MINYDDDYPPETFGDKARMLLSLGMFLCIVLGSLGFILFMMLYVIR